MQPTRRTPNLAARAGSWSARHKKTAILGWIAFVAIAFVLGGAAGTKQLQDEDLGAGQSARADKIQHDAFDQATEESVLVQARPAVFSCYLPLADPNDTVKLQAARASWLERARQWIDEGFSYSACLMPRRGNTMSQTVETPQAAEPGTGHLGQTFLVGENVYLRTIVEDDAKLGMSWMGTILPRSTSRVEKYITEEMKEER